MNFPRRRMEIVFLTLSLLAACCYSQTPTPTPTAEPEMTPEELSGFCRMQATCEDCITSHPECTWCGDNKTQPAEQTIRCKTQAAQTCEAGFLENPQSSADPIKDDDFTVVAEDVIVTSADVITQLKPQTVNVKLRLDQPQTVQIRFRKVVESPLDLYYVMDLSNSMKDDLQTLQDLGSTLADDIRNITKNVQLGFGSFVDKVMMPFASTVEDHLKNPCDEEACSPVFGFRHQLKITEDGTKFRSAVQNTNISGNIDSPEGGFDALMQIAVCQEKIGWRDEALRVILYASDASPHIALDGKLAAILEANDMQCHLETGVHKYLMEDEIYSKSKNLDYPSVGQLKRAFTRHKIQTIFAVTEGVYGLYEKLQGLLENSYAGELAADSSNVVDIIRNSYNELKSIFSLIKPDKPDNVEMKYRVKCPRTDVWVEQSLECRNANSTGDEVLFEFEFTATECPSQKGKIDTMTIASNFIPDRTVINFEYLCDCDCAGMGTPNSDKCQTNGTYECGICNCNDPFQGLTCQCTTTDTGPDEANCRLPSQSAQNSLMCSGNGFCECGACKCYREYGWFGEYCECKAEGCPESGGKMCGGDEQGECRNCDNNPVCVCKNGFSNTEQHAGCSCHDKFCRADRDDPESPVCSGADRGDCNCDHCDCRANFEGSYCETCIHPDCNELDASCSGVEIMSCASCVYEAVRTQTDLAATCNGACKNGTINYKPIDELPECDRYMAEDCRVSFPDYDERDKCQFCQDEINTEIYQPQTCSRLISDIDCRVTYEIVWKRSDKDYFVYVRNFDRNTDCAQPINPILIVGPVVGGIVLVGIILLIAWKIWRTFRDKIEYETFLEDTKKSRWTQGENPLFSKASVRIENPAFMGGK